MFDSDNFETEAVCVSAFLKMSHSKGTVHQLWHLTHFFDSWYQGFSIKKCIKSTVNPAAFIHIAGFSIVIKVKEGS